MTPDEVFQRFERDPSAFTRIPTATYRLQLSATFAFADVRELVPYLAALGISDCHLSPFLQPCSEASHGYDVADHGQLNAALGSEADYRAMGEALRSHDMGQIMDIVPNHMGIAGSRNAWWADVLENGRASPYASFFDIDWDPIKPELKDKVLLPMLGDQYGRVLENQELQLEFRDGAFSVRYYDSVLPVAPRTYVGILGWRLDDLQERLGADHPQLLELRSIITALGHLPPQTEQDPARLEERQREKEVVKRRLATLARESTEVREFVDDNVRRHNGVKGDARSFDRLDDLLARQAYRLSFWQTAGDEINYRRFFDINELAAIRMEEPAVFEAAHRLVFRLVREGAVTGLRIDHPDGLFAPARYLRDLQRRCFLERARYVRSTQEAVSAGPSEWEEELLRGLDRRLVEKPGIADADGGREESTRGGLGLLRRWSAARHAGRGRLGRVVQAILGKPVPAGSLARAFYVVAEKILMPEERLPPRWPVAGTTGYDFLNVVNGLFVDPAGARSLTSTYTRFIGVRLEFAEVAYQSKRLVMETTMASEIAMLGRRLGRISERRRSARDFTDRMLTEALREVVASFPVYRTYVATDDGEVSARDRRYVEAAVAEARRRNPSVSGSIFEFIRGLLCLELPADVTEAERTDILEFVGRFQQLTGPFTAKGIEDTAFYRYHRLVSLNEVGSHPDVFGIGLEEFHQRCRERLARWPAAVSVLSTHDTKRGEDVRARINVLSEIPDEWRTRVRAWHRLNRAKKTRIDGEPAPDNNEEYLLYQTLLGAWPLAPGAGEHGAFVERIQRYMHKALREAKVHMSWVNPRPEYDEAVRSFIARILDPSQPNEFLDDFRPFQARVAGLGIYNSLSQTVLRLAAPGVPELYQSGELWDLSLVDPDNRRPVDFDRRRAVLAELQDRTEGASADLGGLARTLVERRADGRIKLHVIQRGLAYRRQHPRLFLQGDYVPLEIRGDRANHVCAFARTHADEQVVIAVPRLLARLTENGAPLGYPVWGDGRVVLPVGGGDRVYRNLFTGEVIEATDPGEAHRTLALAAVFSGFPVAVLELVSDSMRPKRI
jgi:(1->4)-alpha-D-glucan 1-alpha-D-glucosylmutase